jgi:Family of unknown function (DUF6869)
VPISDPPDELSPDDLAAAYLEHARTHDKALWWAVEWVVLMSLPGNQCRQPGELWALILALVRQLRLDDDSLLAYVAAGPLEDLLAHSGPQYIAEVEAEAAMQPVMARLLTAVWPGSIAPEVWSRVEAIRGRVTNPIP